VSEGVFDPGVLTGPARGLDLGVVRSSRLHSWEEKRTGESLDRFEVLVQYSAAIEADLLCLMDDGVGLDGDDGVGLDGRGPDGNGGDGSGPAGGVPGGSAPDGGGPERLRLPPDSVSVRGTPLPAGAVPDDPMDL
jgi:hypothetical protein